MNTVYFLNLAAGNLFRTKTNPPIPSEMWIGLSTTAPNINGTNVTEPAASAGYGRVKLDMLEEPSSGVVTNGSNVEFNESTASWGIVTHFVIFDAQNGGNLLQYGPLSTPRSVEAMSLLAVRTSAMAERAIYFR